MTKKDELTVLTFHSDAMVVARVMKYDFENLSFLFKCSAQTRVRNKNDAQVLIKRISRALIYHTRWQHRVLYNNTNHTHTHICTHTHTHTHLHTHTCTHTHTHTQCWTRGWAGL